MPLPDKSQKIDASQWLFFKPLSHMYMLPKPVRKDRQFSSEWHDRIGSLRMRPYKEMIASEIPAIKLPEGSKTRQDQKSSVYTRNTRRQHKMKDNLQSLMDVIDTPKGLHHTLSRNLSSQRREHMARVLSQVQKGPKKLALELRSKTYKELNDILDDTMESTPCDSRRCHDKEKAKEGVFDIKAESLRRKTPQMLQQSVEEILQTPKNPYMFMAKKEKDIDKGLKKKGKTKKSKEVEHPWGTPEEIHMKAVVQEYCDWVFDLGGNSDNIDESTLTCLFSGGYETKPALSMPVRAAKPFELPPELVEDHAPESQLSTRSSYAMKSKARHKFKKGGDRTYKPFRYGAWYLDPKTWKKMDVNEPLQDPNILKEWELTEADINRRSMNEDIADLFIPGAFMEYLRSKNARIPLFLLEIAKIQEQRQKDRLNEAEQSLKQ